MKSSSRSSGDDFGIFDGLKATGDVKSQKVLIFLLGLFSEAIQEPPDTLD